MFDAIEASATKIKRNTGKRMFACVKTIHPYGMADYFLLLKLLDRSLVSGSSFRRLNEPDLNKITFIYQIEHILEIAPTNFK